MKRTAVLALAAVLWTASAQADIVEVKGRGLLNGRVVSENESEVRFKDAGGSVHVFPKGDVLFMELDEHDTGGKSKAFSEKAAAMGHKALAALKGLPRKLHNTTDGLTRRFTTAMSKPLDRRQADSKGDQLAHVMDQASQASTALTAKNLNVNREIKAQTKSVNETWGTGKSGSDRKGRFSSLDG